MRITKSKDKTFSIRWVCFMIVTFSLFFPMTTWGQGKSCFVVEELVDMGFENVRWVENESTQIYTIENSNYKLSGIGIKEAVHIIQNNGLSPNKICKIIITQLNIPQISLTYTPSANDSITDIQYRDWQVSYELNKSWEEVKNKKKKKIITGDTDEMVCCFNLFCG